VPVYFSPVSVAIKRLHFPPPRSLPSSLIGSSRSLTLPCFSWGQALGLISDPFPLRRSKGNPPLPLLEPPFFPVLPLHFWVIVAVPAPSLISYLYRPRQRLFPSFPSPGLPGIFFLYLQVVNPPLRLPFPGCIPTTFCIPCIFSPFCLLFISLPLPLMNTDFPFLSDNSIRISPTASISCQPFHLSTPRNLDPHSLENPLLLPFLLLHRPTLHYFSLLSSSLYLWSFLLP